MSRCGHCKNLKPAYEKAAKSLSGIAKVAAVNCDEESNKPFCGSMGVQGFPTLKIIKPSKQSGKRGTVEDYNGPRNANGIMDVVTDKIFNHVMRLKSNSDFEKFVKKTPDRPKGLVFSEKGLVPAFVKTLAIDFLGGIDFGYVRSADKELVSRFGVSSFPKVLLLPIGNDSEVKPYDGDVSKAALVEFFSQIMPPHPDAQQASSSKSTSKQKSTKSKPKATEETLEPDSYPQHPKESPDPNVVADEPKPVQVPLKQQKVDITKLEDPEALQKACLHSKSSTCLLVITPSESTDKPEALLEGLSTIAGKHASRGTKLFPIYQIEDTNAEYQALADGLKLKEAAPVLAVNAKRGWYSIYEGAASAVEDWVDGIRLGDFKKEKLPEGLVRGLEEEVVKIKVEEAEEQKVVKEEAGSEPVVAEDEPVVVVEEGEEEVAEEHDEL